MLRNVAPRCGLDTLVWSGLAGAQLLSKKNRNRRVNPKSRVNS